MPPDDLPNLLRDGESEHVAFKTSVAESGTIVVGMRDDGRVIGADLGEGALEQLSQRVLAGTDPKVFVRLRAEPVDGQPVLRIDVPPGDGPHLANGRALWAPETLTARNRQRRPDAKACQYRDANPVDSSNRTSGPQTGAPRPPHPSPWQEHQPEPNGPRG
jgi:hypothetical protein